MIDRRDGGDRALWRWEGKCLVNKTGLAMEPEGNSQQIQGTRVLGLAYHGLISQQWRLEGKHIRCEANNLVLDIRDANMSTDAHLIVWSKNFRNTPNQLWRLELDFYDLRILSFPRSHIGLSVAKTGS